MWECDYAREPVDYRLLSLRLLKKVWILPLAVLIGAVLFGAGHYISKVCFGDGRTYQTDSLFYIDFAEDSAGNEYEYHNRYTWGEIITTDFFADRVYDELGGALSKEEIRKSSFATVESDVRYLTVRGTNNDKELSLKIERALEKAIVEFGEEKKEFNSITLTKHDDIAKDATNIRLVTAIILGTVVGLFVALIWCVAAAVTDTSVYIPSTLEKRYKVPVIGAPSMAEYESNARIMLKDAERVLLVPGDDKTDISNVELYKEHVKCQNPIAVPSETEKLKDAGCVVVALQAGAHNGKRLERTLEELGRINASVKAFVLIGEDTKLINRYYGK